MSAPNHFVDIPTVRHPLRWSLLALGAIAMLVLTAAPAGAHAEHAPLPEGFAARIAQVIDANGGTATPDVEFTMAADGAAVSVVYRGSEELVILGEQAAEPLVRIAGGEASVNAASPQAVQVAGATVDPAAAADLIDLVWDRVPPAWEPVASGTTVTFMDHRAVPGHTPTRADYRPGDVAGSWSIPFTLGGAEYHLTGDVVAVELPASSSGSSRELVVVTGGVLFVLLIVVFVARRVRGLRRRTQPATSSDTAAEKELAGVR
jgi:hypothetical protein